MFLLYILYMYFDFSFALGDNSKFSFRGSELSGLWSEISCMGTRQRSRETQYATITPTL